ncbi:MAG: hypothetical protein NXI30_13605 [bacterium]|nr:hypothetical protein [bacterium]
MIGRARAGLARWGARARRGRVDWTTAGIDGCEDGTVAIAPGDYLGVSAATRRLFPATVDVDGAALVLASDRRGLVAAILDSAAERIVFSGWVDGYAAVARALAARAPERFLGVLWHGSPMQLADADERRHYAEVMALAAEGVIDRIGFFKSGEGGAQASRGLPAVDVFNPPPTGSPERSPRPGDGKEATLRLGLFVAGPSWRKNPYAMLAAVARLEEARLTGVLDAPAQAHARGLGIALAHVRAHPFDAPALVGLLRAQDCNLYVTLSECSPLLPLESLHLGVPCLIGASSHLFVGTPVVSTPAVDEAAQLLETRLVVPRADDPRAIEAAIRRAVSDRDAILDAYAVWAPAYAEVARASIDRFLADGSGHRA